MVLTKKASKKSPERRPEEEPKKGATRSSTRPKSPARTKSPLRTKSPSRTKSPGRTKSPSRSEIPTADKSPSRRKSGDLAKSPRKPSERSGRLTPTRRSPIRRSPSRSSKLTTENKESAIPVLRKKQKIFETESEEDTADERFEVKEKPKAAVRGRARSDFTEIEQGDYKKDASVESSTTSLLKRVTRSQNKEVERIVHLKHFETTATKLAEFSDEDDLIKPDRAASKSKNLKCSYDYGGPIGVTIFMVALPVLVALLFAFCTDKSCSFRNVPKDLSKYKLVSTYFNAQACCGFIGYFILLSMLSALPVGGRKVSSLPDKHEKFIYVMNGLLSAVIVMFITAGLELKNIRITKFIADHHFHLFVASFVTAVSVSVIAYIRSFYVPVSALNPHIVGKNKIYNFFMGRELHPRFFGVVDMKMLMIRVLHISALLADFAFVYQTLGVNVQLGPSENDTKTINIDPTLLVYFTLRCIYNFDALIFEHTWVTSKEIQQEGFGYCKSVGYLIYPFITSFITKFIVEHQVRLAYWKLGLITLVFLIGYIVYRGSNNQKDAFRKNPYNPNFSHLETIPTTQGKKLLSSGFWGIVRHPNYLGNIIVDLSLVPFVMCAHPVLFIYLNVVFLIHRARRDNSHCKTKYGSSWDRYCNRVKHLLIPKVY